MIIKMVVIPKIIVIIIISTLNVAPPKDFEVLVVADEAAPAPVPDPLGALVVPPVFPALDVVAPVTIVIFAPPTIAEVSVVTVTLVLVVVLLLLLLVVLGARMIVSLKE